MHALPGHAAEQAERLADNRVRPDGERTACRVGGDGSDGGREGERQEEGEHGPGHLAVVPRCWKKLTSPGAAPTTSAAAPDVSAAIRPRAA